MPRKRGISWNDNQKSQLAKAVKNFNAKISRLEKKNDPELKNLLPERVSVKDLKKLIETSQDLNKYVNSLQRFTRKGSEKIVVVPGYSKDKINEMLKEASSPEDIEKIMSYRKNKYNLKTTKWQKNEMSIMARSVNLRRKNRLDTLSNIEASVGGKKLGYKITDIGMGTIEQRSLDPINPFTPSMSRADLNAKLRTLFSEYRDSYWMSRDILLRDTFAEEIIKNYGDTERTRNLYEKLKDMDVKEFYKHFREEPNTFDYVYPVNSSDKVQYNAYLSRIESNFGISFDDTEI